MIKRKILYLLFLLHINTINAQSFVNGDLDGVVNGLGSLPTYWQNVPFGDPNCLAINPGEDTPDLTSLNAPNLGGFNGNPYSGSTFISGYFATENNQNNFWQEGIMQIVLGFTIERTYTIRFHQTVHRNNNSLDKSGSWAVYIDTVLAGITAPTYSNEPIGSTSLPWDARSVTFTARATTHLIKFLPMDDDSNWVTSTTDTLGALRLGIDSIGLDIPTGINSSNLTISEAFKVFPNPNNGIFRLQFAGIITKPFILSITDVYGKLIDNLEITNTTTNYKNTSLMNGLYFYTIKQGTEEVGRGKFLVVK